MNVGSLPDTDPPDQVLPGDMHWDLLGLVVVLYLIATATALWRK